MPETYKIGKLVVSQQAYLVLLAGTTLSALMFIAAVFFASSMAVRVAGMFMSALMFGITCYFAYVVNCTLVGKCTELAWFLTIMNMIVFVIYGFQLVAVVQPTSGSRPKSSNK
jgi:hypothetical protein